jgi:formamidase
MRARFALLAATAASMALAVQADTTTATWQTRVEITKEGAHCADDPNCFNRFHLPRPTVA